MPVTDASPPPDSKLIFFRFFILKCSLFIVNRFAVNDVKICNYNLSCPKGHVTMSSESLKNWAFGQETYIMDSKKMADLSNQIICKYYQNDVQPFLDFADEKVLWYGPAKGQFLSGREALLNAWAGEKHSLYFSLGNMRLDHTSSHPSYCEVLASFPVTTHFPDGKSITMDQIIHITWCERKVDGMDAKQPRMLVIHISDLYQKHEADNIYPNHFNEIYKGYMPVSESGDHVYFQGLDAFDLYLLPDSILWIESISNGRHSVVYTKDEHYVIKASTAEIESTYPNFLLRCHRCYLVNPKHIRSIERFTVTLDNGKELSIPEKKYTAFKKTVYELWRKTLA